MMYIMKKQSQKIYLMLALIPLGACADHEEMCTEAKAGRVIFEMTTTDGASSRTQTDKTGVTTFVGGDEVGIFATKLAGKVTEDLAVNSLYKSVALDDGSLTWGSMDADKMVQATSFYAYYPYNAKDTLRSAIVHSVSTDQGEEEAYNKSDLLTAVKTNVPASIPGERVIKLDFEHKLAMVQVELTGPGVKAAPADFRLINVQPTATINFDKKPGDPQFVTTSGEAIPQI